MMQRRAYFSVLFGLLILSFCSAVAAEENRPTRVAVYVDTGTGRSLKHVLGVLGKQPDLQVDHVSAKDIRAGKLADYDLLVQPGGRSTTQGKILGPAGAEQIRTFVRNGGGYVGICAGAYLATIHSKWCLQILNADVIDREHWNRGYGNVEVSLTPNGRAILGTEAERLTVYYHQGPLLAPGDDPEIPAFDRLAGFETEIAKNKAPKGVMIGTTAIAAGRYGSGRVICFSPHAEMTKGLEDFLYRGVVWAKRR